MASASWSQGVLQSFPDVQWITEELIAEGDWVVQRHTFRGTFEKELAGIPPTGKLIELQGVSMFRVAGGKIVEHWGFADDAGFWHQCGVEVPEIMLAFSHRSQHPERDAVG